MATKLKQTNKITTEEAMQISVKIIKENEDGSANAQVTFNKEGLETLVQWGLVSMLTAAVDAYKPVPEKVSKAPVKRTKTATKKKVNKK
jgi:hypothetical protein